MEQTRAELGAFNAMYMCIMEECDMISLKAGEVSVDYAFFSLTWVILEAYSMWDSPFFMQMMVQLTGFLTLALHMW